jgi:hypothetical protein
MKLFKIIEFAKGETLNLSPYGIDNRTKKENEIKYLQIKRLQNLLTDLMSGKINPHEIIRCSSNDPVKEAQKWILSEIEKLKKN